MPPRLHKWSLVVAPCGPGRCSRDGHRCVGHACQLDSLPSPTTQAYGAELSLQVEHTSTGESAWDLLSSRKYDIALVDVKLPGITGLDLSWCYESSGPAHDTIMIACTSDIDLAELYEHAPLVTWPHMAVARPCPYRGHAACPACSRECRMRPTAAPRHGLKDVLRKPVTMASLRHMLHKWMPRRNASSFKLQSHPTPLGRGAPHARQCCGLHVFRQRDCWGGGGEARGR